MLSKYLKCSFWRLAVLYEIYIYMYIYIYIYIVRRQRVKAIFLLLVLSLKNPSVCIPLFLYTCHMPCPPHLPWFDHLNKIFKDYNLLSSPLFIFPLSYYIPLLRLSLTTLFMKSLRQSRPPYVDKKTVWSTATIFLVRLPGLVLEHSNKYIFFTFTSITFISVI